MSAHIAARKRSDTSRETLLIEKRQPSSENNALLGVLCETMVAINILQYKPNNQYFRAYLEA
jgi:hypothetical protein